MRSNVVQAAIVITSAVGTLWLGFALVVLARSLRGDDPLGFEYRLIPPESQLVFIGTALHTSGPSKATPRRSH